MKIHILGSGNAAKKHRAAMENVGGFEFTDYDDADIIDICTPNYLHFEQCMTALRNGKDAIVEKPICGSLAEFDYIAKRASETGRRVIPMFQQIFTPPDIHDHMFLTWNRPNSYYSNWRGNPDTALGGVISTHGIHYLDNAFYHYDYYRSPPFFLVSCDISTRDGIAVETRADIKLIGAIDEFEIILEIHPDAPNTKAAPFEPYFEELLAGNEPGLTQARPSLELLTACYKSAITGQRVTLPIQPDDEYYHGWTNQLSRKLAPTTGELKWKTG